MKRLLVILFAACLVLGISATALGAIHDSYRDPSRDLWNFAFEVPMYPFIIFDSWYTIDKQQPFYQVSGYQSGTSNLIGGEYFLNDFTFVDGFSGSGTNLKGSYLFKAGFFIGGSILTGEGTETVLSPGYCYNLNDNGYIALSLDYYSDDTISTTMGFEVDYKRYFDRARLLGQVYFSNEEYTDYRGFSDELSYNLCLNYQAADTLVVGASFQSHAGWKFYDVGFSWYPEFMIADFEYVFYDNADSSAIMASAMFKANSNLSLGFYFFKGSEYDDPAIQLKAKYEAFGGFIGAALKLDNDTYDPDFYLCFNKKL
jgi:hypothetical protein